ncbi:tctex1 domain-containing protein 1-B-like [Actinia tenebrosa]|uniref:Tctex1 domain-containing protein 1-B-like n=1 Tax=Actinia tenebrosa TaxID=6105 RepID=A0A6P8I6P1_ACTTE|nr:tctex1 domain-containing protein 1-B-like [Actinia tenebrosa]
MLSTRKTTTFRNPSISMVQSRSNKYSLVPSSECGDSIRGAMPKDIALENTYKMIPDQKFIPGKTKAYIREILEKHLKEKEYDEKKAKELCLKLSEEIKHKVKETWLVNRFKIVCVVHIGKPMGQGMQITSRCLWNPAFDTFATECFSSDKIFGQASVFALYVE